MGKYLITTNVINKQTKQPMGFQLKDLTTEQTFYADILRTLALVQTKQVKYYTIEDNALKNTTGFLVTNEEMTEEKFKSKISSALPSAATPKYNEINQEMIKERLIAANVAKSRPIVKRLFEYCNTPSKHILGVYGLRRTGKSILLYTVADLLMKQNKQVIFLELAETITSDVLNVKMQEIKAVNPDFLFIDEITFIDNAPSWILLLYSYFAASGTHVIVAGTYSFALKLASMDLAFDRIKLLSTTIISYSEYNFLRGEDIKTYLKNGGVLEPTTELWANYFDTAIVTNLAKSLVRTTVVKYKVLANIQEIRVRNLLLYILQEIYLRPFLDDLAVDYEYPDLRQSLDNLLRRRQIFDNVEIHKTEEGIRNALRLEELIVDNIKATFYAVRDALEDMEVLDTREVVYIDSVPSMGKEYYVTQPGLMYYQAVVSKDSVFANISNNKQLMINIGNVIEGKILENIIFRDISRRFPKLRLTQIRAIEFELDIVIADEKNNLWIYEVKRSPVVDDKLSHYLRHAELDKSLTIVYGNYNVIQKAVLYTGRNSTDSFGIPFLNAGEFLQNWEPKI
jgi:DNA polymerase III delta prime subunit